MHKVAMKVFVQYSKVKFLKNAEEFRNGKSKITWQNQMLKHVIRMGNNWDISDSV